MSLALHRDTVVFAFAFTEIRFSVLRLPLATRLPALALVLSSRGLFL